MLDDKVAMIRVKLGHLAVERSREAYLRALIDLCTHVADADRCTVYLVDHATQELYARAAQLLHVDVRLPIGHGIAGAVALTGETVNVPDAYADPRFDPSIDQQSGYRTRNMLVVPVWSRDGQRVSGVIQVLNKRDGTFERTQQIYLERIAEGVSSSLEQMIPAERR